MNDNQLIRLKKDESYTSNRESQDTIRITTQTIPRTPSEFPPQRGSEHSLFHFPSMSFTLKQASLTIIRELFYKWGQQKPGKDPAGRLEQ